MSAILQVAEGDISSFEGEAIVNAANNHLQMGAGVAGALLRRGGGLIQDECDALVRKRGPLKLGEAAVTGAGRLSAKYIIHAAAMGDAPPTEESIRSSTRRALELARELGVQSIAFPILGSGIGGFPFLEAARIMLEEVKSFTAATEEVETVVFYGYTPEQAAMLRRLID